MPKRLGNIWNQITEFDNIFEAYRLTENGKQDKITVNIFKYNLEANLINIKRLLDTNKWIPGKYNYFRIYIPKEREIGCPPFKDTIVHHAILRVIAPYIQNRYIFNSYAVKKGKGIHLAVRMLQRYCREAQSLFHKDKSDIYVIKGDIHHYFQSIDTNILKRKLRCYIKDKRVLNLFDLIIDGYPNNSKHPGIPHGAYMSQFLADMYMDTLDQYITKDLKVRYYLRYMDDFVLIVEDKYIAQHLLKKIRNFLQFNLKLQLNQKTKIFPLSKGIPFTGYITYPTHILPKKENIRRIKKRLRRLLKLFRDKRIDNERFIMIASGIWNSFKGYMRHCNAYNTTFKFWKELDATLKEYKLKLREYDGVNKVSKDTIVDMIFDDDYIEKMGIDLY